MIKDILEIFGPHTFVGPQRQPIRWDAPDHKPQKLLGRDFVLLFLMAMCSNSFVAVYYCFEQWMEGFGIDPTWRGILLSALFAMILIFRPLASVLILRHGKFWYMAISLAVCTAVMVAYPYVSHASAIPTILCLRLIQGVAFAIYSACTIAVLVECIPPGQSARGFALFSLSILLPYAIIPGLSETILPIVGGEAQLFAVFAWLGLPSFIMLLLLGKRLRKPEIPPQQDTKDLRRQMMHAITHSGLSYIYLACLSFSMCTILAVFFMKGLCTLNGERPALFFTTYSITIILVRVFGSHRMDTLPRHKASLVSALALACCMVSFAFAPSYAFIPISCCYGLSLGLLYPLLAAAIYDRSTPETRSISSNIMMAAFDASGMLAPITGGLVISAGFGYRGVFCAAGVYMMICALCVIVDSFRMRALKKKKLLQK